MTASRVLLMVTSEESVILIGGLAKHLASRGMDVHASASPRDRRSQSLDGVTMHRLPMRRTISLGDDLLALKSAWNLIGRVRPDAVVAGTPKAGLLGMVASWLHGVPTRVYVLHGLRLETEHGIKRQLLSGLEWIAAACATRVVAVSASLRDRAIDLRLAQQQKIAVIGLGSATGVDTEQFHKSVAPAQLATLGSPVLAFVGRLTPDKGPALLAGALRLLAARGIAGSLLVLGGDDARESRDLRRSLDESGWDVRHLGQVSDVAPYLALADILCLPSRREGFGTVVIEAAAMGVPTVATRATGLIDAIVDGETGILVPDHEPGQYANALSRLIESPEARSRMGEAARRRVLAEYTADIVLTRWADYLVDLMQHQAAGRGQRRTRHPFSSSIRTRGAVG